MSNRKSLVWLILGIVVLTAAHVVLDWYGTDAPNAERRAAPVNGSIVPNKILLRRPGMPDVLLVNDTGWRITAPFSARADRQSVMRLCDAILTARPEDAITDAELLRLGRTRADLALDPPLLEVTLSDADRSVRLAVGARTPTGTGFYAAVDDFLRVYAFPTNMLSAIDVPAAFFRLRSIGVTDPESVAAFDVRQSGRMPVSFSREGECWRLGDAQASAQKVQALLAALASAEVVDFIWPVGATNEVATVSQTLLAAYGLDAESAVMLTLHGVDGTERRIAFGAEVRGAFAYALVQDGTAVVTLPTALKEMVAAGATGYADARLFPFDAASVTSFSISDGTTDCVVARVGADAWRLETPVSAPADAAFAVETLNRILALSTADASAEGLRVSVASNTAPDRIAREKILGNRRLDDFRAREILRLASVVVKRLVASGDADRTSATAITYDLERKAWNIEKCAHSGKVDDAAVSAVLAALNPLQAVRIEKLKVAPEDLARYQLDKPVFQLAVDSVQTGALRQNILIGAETAGGRFATVGSSDAVFVLSAETVRALSAPLVVEQN